MLNPKQMQSAFIEWMKACYELTEGEVVAIDGKTVRGSYDKSRVLKAIHMVNAFATANGICLAQSKVNEKTNEIPKLQDMLDISGCLVTIDAMGCQRKIAKKILDKNADYLLAVSGNQKSLQMAFDEYYHPTMLNSFVGDSYSTQSNSHGRKETLFALVNTDLSFLADLAY